MISVEQLQEVRAWLVAQKDHVDLQSAMRGEFPDLHFTFCSDDDVMLDEPVSSCDSYNLYLVDASSHCLALTTDLEAASGLVIADCEDDD